MSEVMLTKNKSQISILNDKGARMDPCGTLSEISNSLLNEEPTSSVKWSDPGHFLKAQGKFIFSFLCTLFLHIFDT